jgi:hypothetical protein
VKEVRKWDDDYVKEIESNKTKLPGWQYWFKQYPLLEEVDEQVKSTPTNKVRYESMKAAQEIWRSLINY